jgi:hypothetical protein
MAMACSAVVMELPHGEAVILVDDFHQLIAFQPRNHVDFDATVFKNLLGGRAHFIGN